jgi:Double zinc ribbon
LSLALCAELTAENVFQHRSANPRIVLATATHVIWNNEKIKKPPAKRVVIFKYPEVDRILLNFTADFAMPGSSRTYLDPLKPIIINSKTLKIPDLPSDPSALRMVDRSGVDVTSYFQFGQKETQNLIEVNYIADKTSRIHMDLGRLTMALVVTTPEKLTVRYCFFCGASNKVDANICSRCAKRLEVGGVQTTICSNQNCQATIPLRSDIRFCDKCGTLQEASGNQKTGGVKKCVKCGSSIEADAAFCSRCGAVQ